MRLRGLAKKCGVAHAVIAMLMLVVLTGCQSFEKPGISYNQAGFAEKPVIIQRGEHFYLRYRRALLESRNPYPLLSVLYVKKAKGAGYYCFSIPISHVEWGCVVERPLAYDHFEDFARAGQIYWLDPDGTKHRIPVKPES